MVLNYSIYRSTDKVRIPPGGRGIPIELRSITSATPSALQDVTYMILVKYLSTKRMVHRELQATHERSSLSS